MKLVSDEDASGIDLIEELSSRLDVTENTVYPILRRLTKQGYFNTYKKQSGVGAPRKYYELTDEGKKQLIVYQDEWASFLEEVTSILGGQDE
jgi:PadR family transcriptional regulator PadR